jgi:hypothetical protein
MLITIRTLLRDTFLLNKDYNLKLSMNIEIVLTEFISSKSKYSSCLCLFVLET